nr:hypothetical protein [Tanacetum cinerariifolium]
LRRNQVEDLGPTIEEGEVIDKPMEDIVEIRNNDNKISNGIDEYPSFCNFDRKIHIDCTYNLQFSCMIVMENMNAYHDEGMGNVIVGKPFCREIYVKARRFDGMITIYNGNDGVTYQMARSHPRHLEELHVTWAHLEKKQTRLQTNTKTHEDLCSQSLETVSQAIHDAVTPHQVTTSQYFMMASARTNSNADLEDSFYDGNTNLPHTHHVIPATLRARFKQELQKILAFVDSRLESIEQFLDHFTDQPNETSINDHESDDESVDTPLVSPFPHSDNDSDDEEFLNELSEYENARTLRRERIINSSDGDDLAF